MELAGVDLVDAGLGNQWRKVAAHDQLAYSDLVADVIQGAPGVQIEPVFSRNGVAVNPAMRRFGLTVRASARNCRYIPSPSGGIMSLVDDHEIEGVQLTGSSVDGLNSGDDHWVGGVRAGSGWPNRCRI